jgi:ABC-2 type transport system ATP-binding protein
MTALLEHAVDIQKLRAAYGKREVLHGIDLKVGRGETFGIIGVNGAGKTTLIKILLDLKDEKDGQIAIFGRDRADAAVKSEIAYLPERFDPPWFLTGREFIRFSARLYRRAADNAAIDSYATELALDTGFLDKRVQTYSKGMRQKLGLVATVLTGCAILILDEPMSGLDPLARALVKNMLLRLKEEGRTLILSSHILADMDEICDRIAVIHNGQAQFIGTPSGFKQQTGEATLEQSFLHIVRRQETVSAGQGGSA